MDRDVHEALAHALMHFSGFLTPGSALFKARNPGGLRPIKPEHAFDSEGNRIFNSTVDGLQALLFDLEMKIGGRLGPSSTLTDLALSYGRKPTEAQAWAKFLKKALADETISARTEIRRFLEER